jgi:DNA-binding NarL/FixJ family response regulator
MKILVVDDHALIKGGAPWRAAELKARSRRHRRLELSRGAGACAGECCRARSVLLDLGLPDGDGFGHAGRVARTLPAVAIVVLSAAKDRDSVTKALDLGALGFIPKSASRAVMVSALQLVFAGGIYTVRRRFLQRPQMATHECDPCLPRCHPPSWADGTANRRACTHDAGEEQQGCLPRARSRRGNGEES